MRRKKEPEGPPAFDPEEVRAFETALASDEPCAVATRKIGKKFGRKIAEHAVAFDVAPIASHQSAFLTGFVIGCMAMKKFHDRGGLQEHEGPVPPPPSREDVAELWGA